jgi:hypothetical protein
MPIGIALVIATNLKIPFRNATFFVKNTMKNTAGEA